MEFGCCIQSTISSGLKWKTTTKIKKCHPERTGPQAFLSLGVVSEGSAFRASSLSMNSTLGAHPSRVFCAMDGNHYTHSHPFP